MNSQNDAMTLIVAHLSRIEDKVDFIDTRLDSFERIQVKQEANLAEHMKRSDFLEKHHDILKIQIKPILNVYTVAWGICKIVAGASVLLGVFKLLKFF